MMLVNAGDWAKASWQGSPPGGEVGLHESGRMNRRQGQGCLVWGEMESEEYKGKQAASVLEGQ